MRQRGEHARAVAGVLFVAEAAAMHHAAVHVLGRLDDTPARPSLDVAHEADATGVLLQRRIVQPLTRWQAQGKLFFQCGHRARRGSLVTAKRWRAKRLKMAETRPPIKGDADFGPSYAGSAVVLRITRALAARVSRTHAGARK